jgi:hypothetical protein
MKRAPPVLLSVTLFALTLTPTVRAIGSPAHSRPPGIAASAWVPISHDLAAVIEQMTPDPVQVPGIKRLPAKPSALGYFVAWRGDHWLRLDSLLQQSILRRSPTATSTWMSINKNLAFAIERRIPGQPMGGQPPTPSVLGYFVVRRGGHWLRLWPIAAAALFRGPLTSRSTPDWIRVDKSLRFVIEQQMPQRYVPGQLPSVLGYFVGKRDGRWIRLGSIA